MHRLVKLLLLLVAIAALGALLGLIVRAADFSGGPAYALAGAAFALLAAFGSRFAFGSTIFDPRPSGDQAIEREELHRAAVVAEDDEGAVPTVDIWFEVLVKGHEGRVFLSEPPLVPSTLGARSHRDLGFESPTDFVKVGHGNGDGSKQQD